MIEEDKKLVIETLNGKVESFGMLVEKYQNKMFNLALQMTHDSDASKDIVQDAFVKAYSKLKNFNTDKKFFNWIYRITLNEALNHKKHAKLNIPLDEEIMESNNSLSEEIENDETAIIVQKAINRLEDKYKTLIILKHYHELSYEEISQITKMPVGKVKSRLYSAREKLRTLLESYKCATVD